MNQPLSISSSSANASQAEKLRFILAVLFVFLLPFDKFYSTLVFGLLIITTLIDLSVVKLKSIPKQFWIFQITFLLACIGYVYSSDKAEAGFLLERQLAVFLLPLILPMAFSFNKKRVDILFKSLSISCTLTVLGLFGYLLYILKITDTAVSDMFSPVFLNHKFSSPIGIHAGYLSLYVALSVFFLLREMIVAKPALFLKILYLLSLFVLISGLTFLASRNAIISSLLIVSTLFPFFYVKKKAVFLMILILGLAGGAVLVSRVDYLKERFSTELIGDINPDADDYNDLEPRVERWKFAFDLIKKSPVIGYGTGDEVLVLKEKYKENNFVVSYYSSFNAHNQYLSYLLKNGIIGLLIFLAAFGYYVRLAIRAKDFMYLSFLVLMLIGFLTENILDANKGIFFFAFFNTFLGYNILKSQANKSQEIETGAGEMPA